MREKTKGETKSVHNRIQIMQSVVMLFYICLQWFLFQLINNINIKRFLSGLLLIVFALSITPKRYLHEAFAKHADSRHKKTNDKPFQVSIAGYNCDIDNLVAEPVFVAIQNPVESPLFSSFSSYTLKNISFSSSSGIYTQFRGPPVNI